MQTFFADAQGFAVSGGNFNNVAGDVYNIHNNEIEDEDRDRGVELLYQSMVLGASYDAEQRFPPPNCHPGTRLRILEILHDWICDEVKSTKVFWLYGPAGVGKSAIAQNICEEFAPRRLRSGQPPSAKLAASFFFARRDPHRNNLSRVVTTIAHQLATSEVLGPILKDTIDKAVRIKNDLVHATLELQFQKLILEPCSAVAVKLDHGWKDLPRLVVIDGVDECRDIQSQERLLRMIRQTQNTPSFPLEFLICSRPEPRIKSAFSHKLFHSILDCHGIGKTSQSRKDISTYLRDGFDEIHKNHSRAMAHIALPWPSERIIKQLAKRACGQFIYAATVLKYVGDYSCYPPDRLDVILNIAVPEHFDSPYPDLDLLYIQILSTSAEKEHLMDVLSHLIVPGPDIFFDSRYERTTSSCIEGMLFLKKGKVWALLFGLHSVLRIPEKDSDEIHVLHASFIDFLTDPKRSGKYFVDRRVEARHERIAHHLLRRISYAINHPKDIIYMKSEFDKYAWEFWHQHCRKAILTEELLSALDKFDICGFVNAAMRRRTTCLEACVAALRKNLAILESTAEFLSSHRGAPSKLAERYRVFKPGFQVQPQHGPPMPSTPGCVEVSVEMLIQVVQFDFVMYRAGMWDLISSLLDNQFDAGKASRSHLSNPPLLIVAPLARRADISSHVVHESTMVIKSDTGTSLGNLIDIDFTMCHHRVCIECVRALREPSKFSKEIISYAQFMWIHHLLATTPSTETLNLLYENTHLLLTSDDVKNSIKWVESCFKGSSNIRAQKRLLKQLEKKLEELVNLEQGKKPLERRSRLMWLRKLFGLLHRRQMDRVYR